MLKVVIKTDVPEECCRVRYGDFMVLQRIQPDVDGRIKALVTFKSTNKYEHTIVKGHECRLAKVLLDSGVIVLYAQVKGDKAFWTLACNWDEFKNLVFLLDDLNLGYEILWKSKFFEDKSLTNKEIEMLKLALACGYFENPKRIKLRELANMLDVSEATASSLIRKALKKVVERVITDSPC
jgi:predicted DNA binding protein